MINKLKVKNFKSIKDLELDCKRINLFIGKPNTGKSNILEILGLFSWLNSEVSIEEYVRFRYPYDLFYSRNTDESILIQIDDYLLNMNYNNVQGYVEVRHNDNYIFNLGQSYYGKTNVENVKEFVSLKFYKFKKLSTFPDTTPDSLKHPYGDNLLTLLLTNKELRSYVKDILKEYNLSLLLRPIEHVIEVEWEEEEDVRISLPYNLISDTFQRVIFYQTAIMTNKDAILVFEEPETHAFPYYTKELAESIALDNNQYFISTHNPYFLLSILEKASKDEVSVFITYMKDHQTRVKSLSSNDIKEIMDYGIDIFFNIERFLGEE